MKTRILAICSIMGSLLILASCATSPDDERRKKDMEADVDDILSYELDPAEHGEAKTCLFDSEYKYYHALGNRHLLFMGRQGKLWVNVLRGRCPSLDDESKFIMNPEMGGRLCNKDQFRLIDQFDSLSHASSSPVCFLGEFKPVTEAQVKEIEHRLEMR